MDAAMGQPFGGSPGKKVGFFGDSPTKSKKNVDDSYNDMQS